MTLVVSSIPSLFLVFHSCPIIFCFTCQSSALLERRVGDKRILDQGCSDFGPLYTAQFIDTIEAADLCTANGKLPSKLLLSFSYSMYLPYHFVPNHAVILPLRVLLHSTASPSYVFPLSYLSASTFHPRVSLVFASTDDSLLQSIFGCERIIASFDNHASANASSSHAISSSCSVMVLVRFSHLFIRLFSVRPQLHALNAFIVPFLTLSYPTFK